MDVTLGGYVMCACALFWQRSNMDRGQVVEGFVATCDVQIPCSPFWGGWMSNQYMGGVLSFEFGIRDWVGYKLWFTHGAYDGVSDMVSDPVGRRVRRGFGST